MNLRPVFSVAVVLAASIAMYGQSDADIRNVLTTQVEAWNHGDVETFVTTYAEDCTFVGKQILQGRSNLLARYKKAYPSTQSMGKLSFGNLVVRQLDSQVAIAVGEWHIDRDASSGGPIGGVFSLVLQTRNGKWQIVLDHTT